MTDVRLDTVIMTHYFPVEYFQWYKGVSSRNCNAHAIYLKTTLFSAVSKYTYIKIRFVHLENRTFVEFAEINWDYHIWEAEPIFGSWCSFLYNFWFDKTRLSYFSPSYALCIEFQHEKVTDFTWPCIAYIDRLSPSKIYRAISRCTSIATR